MKHSILVSYKSVIFDTVFSESLILKHFTDVVLNLLISLKDCEKLKVPFLKG